MSIHRRLAEIHKNLMNIKIPKTGYNPHKKFSYHELEDIMPYVIEECYNHEITLEFTFVENTAILKLVDWNDDKKYIPFRINVPELIVPEKNPNNKLIQDTGANVSYLQRYLLKLAFPCISDKDIIDSMDSEGNDDVSSAKKHNTESKKESASKEVKVDVNVPALIVQAKKILKSKGVDENDITLKALKSQVLRMQSWTVPERRVILQYFKEKKEGA